MSAGSTHTSASASSPSSCSSGVVKAACTGPRRPSTTISRIGESAMASMATSAVSVTAELLARERQHPRAVERDVAVADDDHPLDVEVDLEVAVVGVAVVPGDEGRGRQRAGQVLAVDVHAAVDLRADAPHDRVVVAAQVVGREVAADLDVAEEAEARLRRDLLEDARDGLDLRMVRRDALAHEAPRRRQPLEQVDLGPALEEVARGVEAGRAGADHCHAEVLDPRHRPVLEQGSPGGCRSDPCALSTAAGGAAPWPARRRRTASWRPSPCAGRTASWSDSPRALDRLVADQEPDQHRDARRAS